MSGLLLKSADEELRERSVMEFWREVKANNARPKIPYWLQRILPKHIESM
jgi:hypothetical protein